MWHRTLHSSFVFNVLIARNITISLLKVVISIFPGDAGINLSLLRPALYCSSAAAPGAGQFSSIEIHFWKQVQGSRTTAYFVR